GSERETTGPRVLTACWVCATSQSKEDRPACRTLSRQNPSGPPSLPRRSNQPGGPKVEIIAVGGRCGSSDQRRLVSPPLISAEAGRAFGLSPAVPPDRARIC